jgi:hypothetical protein
VGPNFANTNLDTPSLPGSIRGFIEDGEKVIIDVGGDDAGATALGTYSSLLAGADPEVLYVVNRYRSMTTRPEEAEEILCEIEKASRLAATGIVNNSHLKQKTDESVILGSIGFAGEVSARTGLPIKFTAVPRGINLLNKIPNIYPIDVCVKAPWE